MTFSARFGGVSHNIEVPVGNVFAIYAKETGEGMSFEVLSVPPDEDMAASQDSAVDTDMEPVSAGEPEPPQPPKGKPRLRVVK